MEVPESVLFKPYRLIASPREVAGSGERLGGPAPAGSTLSLCRIQRFPVPAPLFGDLPGDNDFMRQIGSYERELFQWRDVIIAGDDGFLILNGTSFLIEPCWTAENITRNPVFTRRLRLPARRRNGRWFSCLLYWGYGYYHWICDVLCRLHAVLPRLPADTRFVVPERMEPWKWRSLELAGVPRERCVQRQGRRFCRAEHFYYATPVAMTGDHDGAALRWLREKAWNHCIGVPGAPSGDRRLYLTRRTAQCRRITNEDDLLPTLREFGFEVVDAESLDFDAQVRLFASASHVVGPHGGAFTNLAWCPPGTKLLEILEPTSIRRCFWSLAHTLEHSYSCALAEAQFSLSERTGNPTGEANMRVPVAAFREAMRAWLAS